MGYFKELAIKQAEEELAYLYEEYHINAILAQAEQREKEERVWEECNMLEDQIQEDKNSET